MSGRHERKFTPPSSTCENYVAFIDALCGDPATLCYPSPAIGYMALCAKHGKPVRSLCVTYDEALAGTSEPDRSHSPIPRQRGGK